MIIVVSFAHINDTQVIGSQDRHFEMTLSFRQGWPAQLIDGGMQSISGRQQHNQFKTLRRGESFVLPRELSPFSTTHEPRLIAALATDAFAGGGQAVLI